MEATSDRPAEGAFRFAPVLTAVFGNLAEEHRRALEEITGSPAVLLPSAAGEQACVFAAVSEGAVEVVPAALESQFGRLGEVAVYRHTRSHPGLDAGRLHDANCMMAVRVYADDDWREPFRRWLQDEHLSRQPATPGVSWAHLYERVDEGDWHFLNLWGADDVAVYDSEEWARIRGTKWYEQVAPVFRACRTERQIFRVDAVPQA